MSLEEQLISRFGPLLSMEQLAELLHRPTKSLSVALSRPGPLSDQLNIARVKIGRKVYFRATDLATVVAIPVSSADSSLPMFSRTRSIS